MPSDLTPEEREAKAEARSEAQEAVMTILSELIEQGWRPPKDIADAIAAAEARGRREGIEAAAKVIEGGIFYHPTAPAALFAKEAARAIRALSSIPPQEADPT
jgi:hypothetical protein